MKSPHPRFALRFLLVFQRSNQKGGQGQCTLACEISNALNAFNGHVGCHIDDLLRSFALLTHPLSTPFFVLLVTAHSWLE